MSKDKMKYTVIRRELEPMNVTIKLQCDKSPLALDVAVAGLHLAIESLKDELEMCPKEGRRPTMIEHLQEAVAQCKRDVERLGRA